MEIQFERLDYAVFMARVQFPAMAEYSIGWSQRSRKWLNLPSMTPLNLWTSKRKVYM